MSITNLPIDGLRSFVTVIDLGGVTRAADLLGRSQPAISLQIRKLEALMGCKLFLVEGRQMVLTEEGKALAIHARQILKLNDDALGQMDRNRTAAPARVGLPVDYSVSFLQELMTGHIHANPGSAAELRCDLSSNLLDHLNRGEIDIAVALYPGGDHQYVLRRWREQPVWVAAERWETGRAGNVPLVTHPEGCEYRKRMIAALSEQRKDWRIVFSSPGIGGLQQAILDGLGVSALTRRTLRPGMRALTVKDGFNPLDDLNIGLFCRTARLNDWGRNIVEFLGENLDTIFAGDS